ncbi:MAG: Uma2 family endonuclease [Oscillatoriales cyanobacterium SM2_1_8]|nr:Uma2 family endonuclease [Oscillatoriales cyanobacterium SM2_1_8]
MVAAAPVKTPPLGEKRVTLSGISWGGYQQILRALPDTRGARLIYDRGLLEITMPAEFHEFASDLIALFVRILVVEMGMDLKTMGSTTLDREDLNRGAEPDCAYYIQNQPRVVGRTVDLRTDPPPDLVVEVDISHSDIDKNRLYAAMGVPEFWRYNGEIWRIFALREGEYQECDRSPTFPWVAKEELYRFLAAARMGESGAELAWRQRVQDHLLNKPSP